ncbi:NAD-dependent epimerase/dehydratase family protein [Actinomycetospora endophytica]|uniref:UDP-glucose 4-epimerase n=1 Tax=Actinomycetospora endophytica TaxID=2291215 RepID=A0ABS8PIZ8_9PSEU|nr:NAD-dependent epimerase/dehydratase family protein [Actinomycetospora endophytica]MCD2198231.1 NAD-dependent epimerase/dehydratase family protein [Actinomycetospora endophytica]
MRVVVTGAGGFVGSAVSAALQASGHDVVGLARDPARLVAGVRPVVGSVLDAEVVAAALDGADAVCHLAARVRVRESREDPLGYWRTNLDGTRTVLAAAGPDVRVVLVSTCAVHAPADVPIGEDAPLAPSNPYAASKLAADLLARDVALAGGPGVVCLRVFNVAGAAAGRGDDDRSRVVPALLAAVAGGRFTVNGDGSAVRDLVHVADLADGVVGALGVAEPGTWRAFTVGSGRGTSVAELIDVVGRVTGRSVPVLHGEAVDEPSRLVADPSRARRELGWAPTRSAPERIVADAWAARPLP